MKNVVANVCALIAAIVLLPCAMYFALPDDAHAQASGPTIRTRQLTVSPGDTVVENLVVNGTCTGCGGGGGGGGVTVEGALSTETYAFTCEAIIPDQAICTPLPAGWTAVTTEEDGLAILTITSPAAGSGESVRMFRVLGNHGSFSCPILQVNGADNSTIIFGYDDVTLSDPCGAFAADIMITRAVFED